MIRTLLIIAGAATVLAVATLGGAAAIGGRDLARHGWAWTFHDKDGESVRFERVTNAADLDLGPTVNRTVAWTGGDSLRVDDSMDVEYVQGPAANVVISGPKALVDRVSLEGGRLSMGHGDETVVFGWDSHGLRARSDRDQLRVVITAPNVSKFTFNGSSDVTITGYDQPTLALDMSGSGDVTATGRTNALTLDIAGSAEADLEGLRTVDAKIDISGSGEATVAPTGHADIDIAGSGTVNLTARPATLNQSITGSGDINQR